MKKRFDNALDFNFALREVTFIVTALGNRKPYSNDKKALEDVEEYPVYVRLNTIDDPSGVNNGADLQIKLRSIDGLKKDQEIQIAPGKSKVVGGFLVYWGKKGKLHGKDWIFINASGKGDHIDAWD